ncbi:hypothetical protein AAG747_28630 [Rapidithrix thailandica]|uniref:Uncharacterized protein n=1 Tax=Rapidithrix thailandica TaxID=413964 RepID=A0AAW9SI05_9BACT
MKVMILCLVILIDYSILNVQAMEGAKLLDFLAKAPNSLFDYTTEGILSEEKNILLKNGESEVWKIIRSQDTLLSIECKYGNSIVHLIPLVSNFGSQVILSYTENERTSMIETWQMEDEKVWKVQLLPSVKAKDFFTEEHRFANVSEYDSNVSLFMEVPSQVISATLNTWMEDEFEDKNIDYEIELKWDGTDFQKIKRKLSQK